LIIEGKLVMFWLFVCFLALPPELNIPVHFALVILEMGFHEQFAWAGFELRSS
jgi:hypothetical protein